MKALLFGLKFVLVVTLGAAALAGTAALLVPAGSGLRQAVTPLGPLNLTIATPASRSVIYDRYGRVMTTLYSQDRSLVKLRDVPQVLIDAVISTEDRKFYEHHGVDYAGTARALFKNVDVGGISQGGSTITQQLVKNALSTDRKRDLKAKAKEAVLAIRLENELSKSQILEDYLNLIYFGNGAYGVQAAVERYFPGTPLKKLTLAQAALLAGLIQSPEALNPVTHPDAAARRRSEVLDAMVENKKTTAAAAKAAKLVPLPTKVAYPNTAPLDYYLDDVKQILARDDPNVAGDPGEVLGSTEQARAHAVYAGGLKIYTSYDPVIQFIASVAVKSQLTPEILSKFTASLVVIDNSDGGVRAIANGRPFAQNQYDPATKYPGRQPGSSFKTFTLAAALSRGYNPNDTVPTTGLHWRIDFGNASTSFYNLSSGDDCSNGQRSLTSAIAASDNCAFVRTELSLGPGHFGADGVKIVTDEAHAMGIDTSAFKPGVVSTTLGTQEVRPVDMAQAYSVLPNDGVLKRATFITKIVGANGKVIYQAPSVGARILDPNVARTEVEMLKGPIRNGTASKTLGNFPRPAAGKTGTTDDKADAWFVGFTPQYTAAVWMGDPSGLTPMTNVGGISVFGATYPAKIWRTFMESATRSLPPYDFTPPDQSLWPRPSFLDENGRRGAFNFIPHQSQSPSPSQTAPPATLNFGASPTVPRVTAPVNNSPDTKKHSHPPSLPATGGP